MGEIYQERYVEHVFVKKTPKQPPKTHLYKEALCRMLFVEKGICNTIFNVCEHKENELPTSDND